MNVAFLANTYHLTKTKSSDFFIDLLQSWFGSVEVIPHKDAWARLPGTPWDLIVVWQHQFAAAELEAFGARSVVLVPMYDDCPKDPEYWKQYAGFKVVCFSSTLARELEGCGLETVAVQYRPPVPQAQVDFDRPLRGFFWPRTASLDWRHVGPLAGQVRWKSFHLHTGHTPADAVLPETTELPGVEWTRTQWFDNAHDLGQVLAQSQIVFAPRRYEGIGMALLESLALGQCVVAPNYPTANEYITHGVDGFLYDPDEPPTLDWSLAPTLGSEARRRAELGRSQWLDGLSTLEAFLRTPPRVSRRGRHPWIIVRGRVLALGRTVYRWVKGMKSR